MKIENSKITLSTGKMFYAYKDILAVYRKDNKVLLYDGFYGNISTTHDEDTYFTIEEREEICNHMCDLWKEWKDKCYKIAKQP